MTININKVNFKYFLKEQTIDNHKTHESQKTYAELKKVDIREYEMLESV